jgi:hypothetical protein
LNLPTFFIQTSLEGAGKFKGLNNAALCIGSNSRKTDDSESAVADLLCKYLDQVPVLSSKFTQVNFKFCDLTPYEFTDNLDPRIRLFDQAGLAYVVKAAEGGLSRAMWKNAVLASSEPTQPIDISARFSIAYVRVNLKRFFARFIIEASNNSDYVLSLSDSLGQATIDQIQATGQSELDRYAALNVLEKTTLTAIPYFEWKAGNPIDFNAKIYSGLSFTQSVRYGLNGLIINLNLSF